MLRLTRYAETTDEQGRLCETLGRLRVLDGEAEAYSCKALELPGRGNENGVSRIPSGTYVAEVVDSSPAFDYEHIWIHDEGSVYAAGDRSGVKIHVANYARQLRGCVAPGTGFADLDGDGQVDVARSERALKALVAAVQEVAPGEVMTMKIRSIAEPERADTAALEPLDTPNIRALTKL
jgi:hypothetical protein